MKKKGILALFAALAFAGVPFINTEAVFSETAFDMKKTVSYVWEGNEVYQESVLVVEEEDGTIAPIDLLYPIDEVVEVLNASLTKRYEENTDYTVENGKLIVKGGGDIPTLSYSEFHPTTGTAGFEAVGGGYVQWKEGSWYHSRQIVVTYKHSSSYSEYVPEGKGVLLPKTLEKLKGSELNVLVYGDSISTGGNSSGHPQINVAPFMPIYPQLFCEGIKLEYGVENVSLYNASLGGTDSAWGLSSLRERVFDKCEKIDLAILAFGMNDVNKDPSAYASNMRRMVNGLKTKYDDIEFLVVAPMLPNPEAVNFYGKQPQFAEALMPNEGEGVAIVNVTDLHAGLLKTKRYADMTGNNINHANDFLARIYAQALLKTLEVSDYGKIEEGDSAIGSSSVEESSSVDESTGKKGCGASAGFGGLIAGLAAAGLILKKKII